MGAGPACRARCLGGLDACKQHALAACIATALAACVALACCVFAWEKADAEGEQVQLPAIPAWRYPPVASQVSWRQALFEAVWRIDLPDGSALRATTAGSPAAEMEHTHTFPASMVHGQVFVLPTCQGFMDEERGCVEDALLLLLKAHVVGPGTVTAGAAETTLSGGAMRGIALHVGETAASEAWVQRLLHVGRALGQPCILRWGAAFPPSPEDLHPPPIVLTTMPTSSMLRGVAGAVQARFARQVPRSASDAAGRMVHTPSLAEWAAQGGQAPPNRGHVRPRALKLEHSGRMELVNAHAVLASREADADQAEEL